MTKLRDTGKWLQNWWIGTDPIDKLLLLMLFTLTGRLLKDPDFGWQLRTGQDLLHTFQIPKFDPYAYTMPNYPWINHEWLSEGIVAIIYKYGGAFVLIALFAIVVIWGFWLATSAFANIDRKTKLVAIALSLLVNLGLWGVRMQMISVLGVGVILWSFWRYRQGKTRHIWWYVPMFLVWANLHGGFLMGLGVLGLIWLTEAAKYWLSVHGPRVAKRWQEFELTLKLNQLKHIFWVGLASGAVTLINPYGWKLYQDFYALFSNSFALAYLNEWRHISLFDSSGQGFLPYVFLLAIIMAFTYRKIEPTRVVVALVLLILALISRRNSPFFLLVSVGFWAEAINPLIITISAILQRYRALTIIILLVGGYLTLPNLYWLTKEMNNLTTLSALYNYPLQAVEWAKANPDKLGSRMYNPYGWGGFLIWQFPEQKVFIDGRMSYWQLNNKFPFKDYFPIEAGLNEAISGMQDRYGIDWVLIKTNWPLDKALAQRSDWKLLYSDQIAKIYKKKIKYENPRQNLSWIRTSFYSVCFG